ncbi:MAG: type II toxin-antitoxin system HicA family toxin [Chloroflexaceae bacterium]|nr:type II toxin-antitoxin system HicA family toxin [Chloroflexaceae bacterium]
MTKKEKLLKRLKNNPNNVTFTDVRKLMEQENFRLDHITGSHHVFKREEVTFVIPVHNNRVKSIYVKRAIELIEQDNQKGEN